MWFWVAAATSSLLLSHLNNCPVCLLKPLCISRIIDGNIDLSNSKADRQASI